MSVGSPVAGDVPGIFDLVLAGYGGYQFLRTVDTSLPFRTQRASYSFTPTFVERQNVSGAYGDDQQAFFLTASQKDWSLGQGQRFFHGSDADSSRRFYASSAVHVGVPGLVQIRPAASTLTAGTIKASCPRGAAQALDGHAYVDSTNLYTVNSAGTITTVGAHGAGTPDRWGMCTDGVNVYIAGTSQIRKWTGSAFSSFGTNADVGSLAFLNNTLYSCDGSTLKQYDGTGTATTLFTWKDATNTAVAAGQHAKLAAFGGQLLIYFPYLADRPELWMYDGVGTKRVAAFSGSMVGYDLHVMNGTAFMSGLVYDIPDSANAPTGLIEVVMYWVNGTIGELWRSTVGGDTAADFSSTSYPALGSVNGKLVFTDPNSGLLMQWDPATGAISALCAIDSPVAAGSKSFPGQLSSCATSVIATWNTSGVAGTFYPTTAYATLGTVTSSIFDFENSLTKQFRSIKVDFTGSGTVDIAYAVDAVTGHTSLQTSAVSGTEYLLPANTAGRGLSYKVTLNKSGGNVPIVKRVYMRASPVLQSYHHDEFILDLSGRDGETHVRLNNDADHPLDGLAQATNLLSAITTTTPFTVTTRHASYSAVIEPAQSELIEIRPEEYIGRIVVRGV